MIVGHSVGAPEAMALKAGGLNISPYKYYYREVKTK